MQEDNEKYTMIILFLKLLGSVKLGKCVTVGLFVFYYAIPYFSEFWTDHFE